MNGSFFDMLVGILGMSGDQQSPQILGTLLSFLFMAVMVLFKFIFPLLGLVTGAQQPANLQRQAVEALLWIALTCACWFLPISSFVNVALVPILSFAALT
ncbi:MAG: hypothetical protein ACRC6I_06855, partial [Paracoccaceae bacterium]